MCGLTRAEDARAAVRAGADALGVILAPGHRRSLSVEEAAAVLADTPAGVTRVGVFVNAPLGEVCGDVALLGLDEVQLHGDESPGYCAAVPAAVVKALHVGPDFDRSLVEAYRGAVGAVLLDTLVEGIVGGSGRVFDWEAAWGVPDVGPVYVAGGLRPDNVAEVVWLLRPSGVDVSSGVETSVGVKSARMMEEFVAAVRAADAGIEECGR